MNDLTAANAAALTPKSAEPVIIDDRTANNIDEQVRALFAKLTRGMSLLELALAYLDWLGHLAISPGKRLQLTESLIRKLLQLGVYNARALLGQQRDTPVSSSNRRLNGEEWQRWPFNVFAKSWLLTRQWSQEATTGVTGVDKEHQLLVAFMAEQILEAVSPANFPLTNPEIQQVTKQEKGRNFVRGIGHIIGDYKRQRTGQGPPGAENFLVGKNVAVT